MFSGSVGGAGFCPSTSRGSKAVPKREHCLVATQKHARAKGTIWGALGSKNNNQVTQAVCKFHDCCGSGKFSTESGRGFARHLQNRHIILEKQIAKSLGFCGQTSNFRSNCLELCPRLGFFFRIPRSIKRNDHIPIREGGKLCSHSVRIFRPQQNSLPGWAGQQKSKLLVFYKPWFSPQKCKVHELRK